MQRGKQIQEFAGKMVDKEVLKKALIDGAVITDEELPSDAKNRMKRLIERVKKEYTFSKAGFNVSKEFELVDDPEAEAKLLFDSLSKATLKAKECVLKGAFLDIYDGADNQPLLLRTAYFDIFELILDGLQIKLPNYHNLVLGSPGIGKSLFHPFCMYVLIKANAPVFFQRRNYSGLFYEGRVYKSKVPLEESTLLSRSNIWVLYDREESPQTIAPKNISIVVSSPKRARYWDYLKNSGCPAPLYMPLWSFAELSHINGHLQDEFKITTDELKKRFEFCGGVPHSIFINFSFFKKILEQTLRKLSLKDIDANDIENLNEYLFGLKVPKNYFKCKVQFLSNTIAADVDRLIRENASTFP